MIETVRILVVDDEQPVRDSLKLWFEASKTFHFEVLCVESPDGCVKLEDELDRRFDVCVIDLAFEHDRIPDHVGLKMLLGLSCVRENGMAVVYSGYPAVRNIVRAMQFGATDFVSKADCPPHQFVEHVQSLLIERDRRQEVFQQITNFLREHYEEIGRQYAGRVLAIISHESQTQVVTDGRSRLDALLRYAELRKKGAHAEWPAYPHLHVVPAPEPT